MRGSRTTGISAMVASAAVWAVVLLAPGELTPEPARLDPVAEGIPLTGPLALAFDQVDARLAERVPDLGTDDRGQLSAAIVREAMAAGLDPLLVLAVIEVESSFDAEARSGAGALGLMQLRETTLRDELRRHGLAGDPFDPVTNVRAGVRYLRRLMDSFPREDEALMAYNAGPNRILGFLRAGEIPERFQSYPRRVKAVLRRLRRDVAASDPQLAAARAPGQRLAVAD
jgi:soluble lytic murein transglycosylase-like protein